MNSCIETLNRWGGQFPGFAWPMLWQSSLLIAFVFALDWLLRRKLRAAVRYALWLVVLVKLLLPPSLAMPTSPAWWLRFLPQVPAKPQTTHYVVSYDNESAREPLPRTVPPPAPVKPALTAMAWMLTVSGAVSAGLLVWLVFRWRQVVRTARTAVQAEALAPIIAEARQAAGAHSRIQVKITGDSMSPAVCGLFHPVILLPQSLAKKLSPDQMRAVLLHELIHLRRGDVWVNCAQALVQIFYWWHPLVWFANARIRRAREEAVDDTVMLVLHDDAEIYAPTLLEVAKFAFHRPLASLGLVGILESRSALRQRIERLVNFRAPRKAGLTLVSFLGILAFTAVAAPMGGSPQPNSNNDAVLLPKKTNSSPTQIHIKARFIEVPEEMVKSLGANFIPTDVTNVAGFLNGPNLQLVIHTLEQRSGTEELAEPEFTTISGRQTQMRATKIVTIITNFAYEEISNRSAIYPQQSQVEIGPILDVVPVALSDGYTINLTLIPSVTEFLGYDKPPTNSIPTVTSTGATINVPTILPRFRVRQASTHLKLWDGQTVVLGGLISSQIQTIKDKEPDSGRSSAETPRFRTQTTRTVKKQQLLVLITVTLVDPTGNRIHSDDEMLFATKSIPPQDSP